MTAAPSVDRIDVDTYAPLFEITVDGQQLDPSTRGDVLTLKVDMDTENFDRFDFTVNNWDDVSLDFKYSDTTVFDVGRTVVVKLGYAKHLLTVMSGTIETLTPRFPESGSSTLAVAGRCSFAKLSGRKPQPKDQKQFLNKTDWEIAEIVGKRNGLKVEVDRDGPKHPEVWQRDLDEAAFLMERAKRIDFDCFVQVALSSGGGKPVETLYFKKPARNQVHTFKWGESLMSFSPKLNAARQVASVTVHGWDPEKKEAIEYKAEAASLPGSKGKGKSGPDLADRKGDEVVDAPVASKAEAQKLAESLLRDRAYQFITGDGRVMGVPEMRPGDTVTLQGLGQRFSGDYTVLQVSHSLGGDGFTTSFGVRKLYDGGTR
jgi:uncharacterized protein